MLLRDKQKAKIHEPYENLFVMHLIFRVFSIIAYLFIFLEGWIIQLPLCLLLVDGLFTAELLMKVLIVLADISLITLFIFSFKKLTKYSWIIDCICFIFLLLPLLKIFTSFPFEMFNYFLFLFPSICFIVLFLLSIVLSYRKYIREV